MAQKYRARARNPGSQCLGVLNRQNEVLGRIHVGQGYGFTGITDNDDPAVVERPARDDPARQSLDSRRYGLADGLSHSLVRRNHEDLAVGAMLRLRQHVGSDEFRAGGMVDDDGDLRGAGRHIDRDSFAIYHELGRRHVGVARPENLVDAGDAFRTVCHGRDGLGSADSIHVVDTKHAGGEEDGRMKAAGPVRRRTEYDLPASGEPGRDAEHEHRGKQRRGTAGDVQPHPLDRHVPSPAHHARHRLDAFGLCTLGFVEGLDVSAGQADGVAKRGRDCARSRVEILGRDPG